MLTDGFRSLIEPVGPWWPRRGSRPLLLGGVIHNTIAWCRQLAHMVRRGAMALERALELLRDNARGLALERLPGGGAARRLRRMRLRRGIARRCAAWFDEAMAGRRLMFRPTRRGTRGIPPDPTTSHHSPPLPTTSPQAPEANCFALRGPSTETTPPVLPPKRRQAAGERILHTSPAGALIATFRRRDGKLTIPWRCRGGRLRWLSPALQSDEIEQRLGRRLGGFELQRANLARMRGQADWEARRAARETRRPDGWTGPRWSDGRPIRAVVVYGERQQHRCPSALLGTIMHRIARGLRT